MAHEDRKHEKESDFRACYQAGCRRHECRLANTRYRRQRHRILNSTPPELFLVKSEQDDEEKILLNAARNIGDKNG